MTRVYWDTNLFIYLLQADPQFGKRVEYLRRRSIERSDELCTSALAIGEVLAGVYRDKTEEDAELVSKGIQRAGVRILPFDVGAIGFFGRIRAKHRTSAADTIHLACAAAAGVDLFLTNDNSLVKLHIPGIKFIASMNSDVL
jgi:predicted nucleic acid-binding protein